MAIQKHVHKLRRHEYKNNEQIYFCVLDCDYKIKVELALGKTTLCNKCNKPFILNPYALRLAKPICSSCKGVKSPKIDLTEVLHEHTPEPSYPSRSAISDDNSDILSRLRKVIDKSDTAETQIDDAIKDDLL